MLKPEEDIEVGGRESAIDIGGPRSPPPYDIEEEGTAQPAGETITTTTSTNGHQAAPAAKTASTRKRIQFSMPKNMPNMSAVMNSRIQWIPTNRQGQLNTGFLKTIPGVLKIAETIIAFILWILSICSDRRSTSAGWTEYISFEAMVVVSGLIIGYVVFPHLTIRDEATREGLIVVEMLYYGFNALLFFVAIWLMVFLSASWDTQGRGAAIIAAILCVVMTVLFAIETIHKFKAWKVENSSNTRVINTAETPTGRPYGTNAELSRDSGSELA